MGALNAGLSGAYAYPGTPSTEILEYIQAHPLTTERARLMISVAAPEFREELERAAVKRFGYSFLRLK